MLDPGDLLLTVNGTTVMVDGLDWGSVRTATAYNLSVDDIHTYFVAVGDSEVLVHNTNTCATESAGRPVYPPNRGFEFDPIETTLEPGSSIDRYGPRSGTFASPVGTPFGQRSLPVSAASKPYEAYEVLKPIEGVNMGLARPWFGQPGLGVQYELPAPIQQLIDDGFLREKK